MFDISSKSHTLRIASAQAVLYLRPDTLQRIREHSIPKGDPFPVARVAAVQAAKNTSSLIPYCHPVPIDHVAVDFHTGERSVTVTVTVKAVYKTGLEMEALTAATAAALTLYDMLKMIDATMEIGSVSVTEKSGGKSDYLTAYERTLEAAVLVMSDTIAAGNKKDYSGKLIEERLIREGVRVASYDIVPDDTEVIKTMLKKYADEMQLDLVLTTGGTGFSPRDFSPEATRQVIEREIPGISETLRSYGQHRTPFSMLSRGTAGLRGTTLIVNLPGSRRGVTESLDALFPGLLHSFKMINGGGHSFESERSDTDMEEQRKPTHETEVKP
jgi:cyclic pyranopterin monophosphate synthase